MSEPRYLSINDAQQRLSQTLVRYEGNPFYISDVDPDTPEHVLGSIYHQVSKNKVKMEPVSVNYNFDSALDIQCFSSKLGLFNSTFKKNQIISSSSLQRYPRRHYKQGYSDANSFCVPLSEHHKGRLSNRPSIFIKDICRSYFDLFEDFRFFEDKVKKGEAESFSISRNVGFSLFKDKKGFIHNGELICGFFDVNKGEFAFNDVLNDFEREVVRKEMKEKGCNYNERF